MVDLNKYSKKDKSEIFHSSGHAQLGFGDRIGSGANTTFNQRLEAVKKEKRAVGAYHRSKIGSQRGIVPKSSSSTNSGSTESAASTKDSASAKIESNVAKAGPEIKFKEPPKRKYTPFS